MRGLGLLLIGIWPALALAGPLQINPWPWPDTLATRELEEVVVSSEPVDGAIPAGNRAATTETVEAYLQRLGGVDLVRRGLYAAEPVFRGMAGERAPVTINNMKIFGACTDKMDPASSYVAVNNLKAIALIKEAGSGQSMNATAGVINLQTKTPVFSSESRWHSRAGAGFSSVNNEWSGQLSTAYSAPRWAMRLNATYRNAGNYRAGGGDEVPFSQYRKTNVAVSASRLVSREALLSAEYIFDLAGPVGYPALPMDVSRARAHIYSLTLNSYDSRGEWEARLYGNNIYHQMDDSERQVVMHMDMPGCSSTYGLYLTRLAEKGPNKITATLDYYLNRSRAEMTMYPEGEIPMFMLTWPDVLKNSLAVSAGLERQVSGNLSLTASLRLEAGTNRIRDAFGLRQLEAIGITGITGNHFWLPGISAGLRLKAGAFSQWNVQLAYSQRQASVSEGFGYYLFNIQDNYDYIGDPRLRPESSLKLEGGYEYKKGNLNLSGQVFGYYMPGYIIGEVRPGYSPMTIGASGVKFYVNLPGARMYGLEGRIYWQPQPGVMLASRLGYTRGTDHRGRPLPLVPPLKNTTTVSFRPGKWQLAAEVQSALAQRQPRTEFGETATPGYAILNMEAGYTLVWQQWSLKVMVQARNLLDQYYWDHLDFNTLPRPGRSINFSVVADW